jgi:hypothetical protein
MAWLILAALAAGYALGRIKPAARASSWAHWLMYDRPTRRQPVWWVAQVVFLCEIAVMLATRPRDFARAWLHRNDPPPPRSPAVRIRNFDEEPSS